ncbi:MAG TPA: hypothetical protein VGO63_02820 [Candidatus Paceibacterota bacterium]|nr:hypothetical protein [Candidatus Paceibacterota bacterium]
MLFVVSLFLFKNKTIFKNTRADGLVYNGNEQVADLVERDTDEDGVSDWQESLYGTDPTKKDTNDDGVPDNIEIARRQGQTAQNGELNLNIQGDEGALTQTDQFSRELFSTVAALNQAGGVDQSTVDTLTDSLMGKIQNPQAKKIFVYTDMKVIQDDSKQAVKNYNDTLNKIYAKYPIKYTVTYILQKLIIDENDIDETVLPQLDPIIKQMNNIIRDMSQVNVPPSLAYLHLNMLNALEKLSENVSDIRVYDTDVIVAMSGISQYETNADALEVATNNLANTINQRLK